MDEESRTVHAGGETHSAAGGEDSKPREHHMIPVWFFVGMILLIYGVIILATGIYEFHNPPPTILSNLHPSLWWGAFLAILGGVYVYAYMPKKP